MDDSRLDELQPRYQFSERHGRAVAAPLARTYREISAGTLGRHDALSL